MTTPPPVDVVELAARYGFEAEAHELAALARPAIELLPAEEGSPEDPIVGWLGGLPELPQGVAWPRSTRDFDRGAPLTFLGSLDLAALPGDAWPGPTSGILDLFALAIVDGMYIDGGAVALHHPADAARRPVDAPSDLPTPLRLRQLPIRARAVMTLPWIGAGAARELIPLGFDNAPLDRIERYFELASAVADRDPRSRPNQLCGWPRFAQDDIHYAWESGATSQPPGGGWQLLLQLGEAYRLGAEFGDGGIVLVGIPSRALAAGDFSTVEAFSDSG